MLAGGVMNEPMPEGAFTNILRSTLNNAGYFCGPSIHAIRRGLGKKIEGKCSSNEASAARKVAPVYLRSV